MIIGQHLFTKDGRHAGNAIITYITHKNGQVLYSLETDFGNVIRDISEEEIMTGWHITHRGGNIMLSNVDKWRARKGELVNKRQHNITGGQHCHEKRAND